MQHMKTIYLFLIFSLSFGQLFANDYNASIFGCVSDGQTNNSESIQAAIDTISSRGGGTLHFYVGRYLSGGLELKSNVTIHLHEGAALVASPSYYDFIEKNGKRYFIYAEEQSNFGIQGKGMIIGQAEAVLPKIDQQIARNIVSQPLDKLRPTLIGLNNCQRVTMTGVRLDDSAGDLIHLDNCEAVTLKNQILESHNYPLSRGIVLHQSKDLKLEDLYVDTGGKALVKDRASHISSFQNSIRPNGKSIK